MYATKGAAECMHDIVFCDPTWIPEARLRVKLYKNMSQVLWPQMRKAVSKALLDQQTMA